MQLNGWDHALKVTSDGKGLVGHAGAILLRKAADQAGLSAVLSAALRKKNASPLFDRGIGELVSGHLDRQAIRPAGILQQHLSQGSARRVPFSGLACAAPPGPLRRQPSCARRARSG